MAAECEGRIPIGVSAIAGLKIQQMLMPRHDLITTNLRSIDYQLWSASPGRCSGRLRGLASRRHACDLLPDLAAEGIELVFLGRLQPEPAEFADDRVARRAFKHPGNLRTGIALVPPLCQRGDTIISPNAKNRWHQLPFPRTIRRNFSCAAIRSFRWRHQ